MSKNIANRSQPSFADPISGTLPTHEHLQAMSAQLTKGHVMKGQDMNPIGAANDDDVTLALMPDYTRLQLDSADMTHVKTPNPALLAMARGEHVKRPKRRTWFVLGMISGAFAMWLLIGDLRPAIDAVHAITARAAQSIDHAPAPAAAPAAATH